jgi:hypothetical protein
LGGLSHLFLPHVLSMPRSEHVAKPKDNDGNKAQAEECGAVAS